MPMSVNLYQFNKYLTKEIEHTSAHGDRKLSGSDELKLWILWDVFADFIRTGWIKPNITNKSQNWQGYIY